MSGGNVSVQCDWEEGQDSGAPVIGGETLCVARHVAARPLRSRWIQICCNLLAAVSIAVAMLAAPATSSAAVIVSVSFGPPALPYYEQPPCPAPGYMWTPGYWAWTPDDNYFWVPGTWVMAPFPGALWTPGYWAYSDEGAYEWREGYWGPEVGFYGGVAYGFGYTGYGYQGGYWNRDQFYYNRSVSNVHTTNITNVYEKTVVNNLNVTRVSYNGGPNGTTAQPTAEQRTAESQRRSGPAAEQMQHVRAAQNQPELRATENKGKPEVAATARPGDFSGRNVVRASRAGAPYVPPAAKPMRPDRANPPQERAPNASPGGQPRQVPETRAPMTKPPAEREAQPPPVRTQTPNEKHPRGEATQEPPRRAEPSPERREPAPHAQEPRPGREKREPPR